MSDESQRDQKLSKRITKIGGDAVAEAWSSLTTAINANKTLHSRLVGLTSDGSANVTTPPVFPSLAEYLDQFPDSLPQLPPILDPKIEKIVFTHVGSVNASEQFLSYERLEFIGDAYIELIARRLAYQYFPNAMEGKLASIRQELVNNQTLAQFSFQYGFDERLKFPDRFLECGLGNDFRKTFQKMFGDVFEAYAAAIVGTDPENGFHVLERWLMSLWKPRLLHHKNKVPMDEEAKVKLSQKLAGRDIKVQYIDEDQEVYKGGTTYTVGAYINGWGWQNEHLGSGTGESKKEAGK